MGLHQELALFICSDNGQVDKLGQESPWTMFSDGRRISRKARAAGGRIEDAKIGSDQDGQD